MAVSPFRTRDCASESGRNERPFTLTVLMQIFVKSVVKLFSSKNGLRLIKLFSGGNRCGKGDQGGGMSSAKIQVYVTGENNVDC